MHYAIDNVDQLMKKTMQFFTTDENKPSLPTPPPPLASSYTHPNTLIFKIQMIYRDIICTNYGVEGGS